MHSLLGGDVDNWNLLLAVEDGQGFQSILFCFGLGVIFFCVGVYGIVTKRLMIWGRERWLFSLVGLNESSPGFAALIGSCYSGFGLLLIVICSLTLMRQSREAKAEKEKERIVDLSDLNIPTRIPVEIDHRGNLPKRNPAPSAAPASDDAAKKTSPAPPPGKSLEQMRAERQQAEAERAAAQRERERLAKEAEDKMRLEKEAARKAATELPPPSKPLQELTYAETAVQEGTRLGNKDGESFTDKAPPGGLMVGAIFHIGTNYGASVAGIQPIYQVGDKYVKGKICGDETDDLVLQLAKAGEVVAGFKVQSGRIIDGAQLAFGPLQGSTVDSQQAYFDVHAGSFGGRPSEYLADGKTIAGVYGTYQKGKSVSSLGLYVVDRVQMAGAPPEHEIRTFTSANGKFTIEARFVKLNEDGTVSLEKEDGSKVKAPLASLSAEDQAYVNSVR